MCWERTEHIADKKKYISATRQWTDLVVYGPTLDLHFVSPSGADEDGPHRHVGEFGDAFEDNARALANL